MRLFIFSLLLVSPVVFGCPAGSDADIKVIGKISLEVLPGPPNYESVKTGDKAEKYWFINLKKSVCFSPDSEFMDSEVSLSKLQLILYKLQDIDNLKEQKMYEVEGITEAAHTGHHRTKVMIIVNSIKEL